MEMHPILGIIEGHFTIKVPLFDHMTQGLCFCFLSNIKYKWNKFK
jgi:hypothetical protein